MDTPTGSLEDYLKQSMAGFKQGQEFYERAHNFLRAKERLSVSEFFLLKSFDHDQKYLVEFMTEATDKEDLYARVIKGKYLSQELDYKKLANLEKRLNEAKEKGEIIDLTVTKHTGGLDVWSVGVSHTTIYPNIKVKDWYFKGTALYVLPMGTYCFKTERYFDGKLHDVESCCKHPARESHYTGGSGCSCSGEAMIKDPICQRVEISSCANNKGGIK